MNISRFFIERPIFAAMLSALILLVGLIALPGLPISEYPEVVPPQVVVTAAYPGADERFLRHAVATGARGIVLSALGRGNIPPRMLAGVREAVAAGVVVVVASRCGRGRTAPTYGYEGGGVTLQDAGAIFSGDLPAPKARIKLMVLLGAGSSAGTIRESFERPPA